MKRFNLREIYIKRIVKAISRRLKKIPFRIKWLYTKSGIKHRKRNKIFKNIHRDDRCFLIANGPSLTKTNLSFLNNKFSIGLNRIYMLYEKFNFKNDYLVSVNNLVLEQFHEDFNNLKLAKFVNWENKGLFAEDNHTYFLYDSFSCKKFSKDISKYINPAATVTYSALQIAYYMGFKEVIILGLDHNFKTKIKNKPNLEETVTTADLNHFSKDYFPIGSKWETPDLKSSEYYYYIAKHIFESNNRRIIDCTINGKCNVFEKGNLEDWI